MKRILAMSLLAASFQAHGSDNWSELRQKSMLTDQTSTTGRNDLCAAAAAVNLAQGLAKQLNRTPIERPHDMFEDIVKTYPGKKDDIGIFQMIQTVQTVLGRAFPHDKFKIEAILLNRYSEKNMSGIRSVEQVFKDDLTPAPNEKKILNIDLFDGAGNYMGGHAVVVDSITGDQLKFINSFEPNADSRAKMYSSAGSMWHGHQIPTFKILSPTPASLGSPHAFFVRGVITVKPAKN